MTDCDFELIQLAAKAAGIRLEPFLSGLIAMNDDVRAEWNPLEDDGDALRLAVKLRMIVDGDGEIFTVSTATPKGTSVMAHENHNGDIYAATRRAIVRAAAKIGSNS